MSRTAAVVIMWMLVDSSGSTNPLARPKATTFLFHAFLRRPALIRMSHGSFTGRAAGIRHETMARLVVRHVPAAEHDAVADAMLHRNVPAPSGLCA